MNSQTRKILFGFYVIVGLLSEFFILWLFPFTGLGGLICWPATILFSLALGYILFRLTKKNIKIWQIVILFIIIFGFQTYLQLWTIPQDFGGDALTKISSVYKAYKNFDNIQFSDFPNLTDAERVAFIYKFKSKLPETFTILRIESSNSDNSKPHIYVLENTNGQRLYDLTKLKIVENDTATIIIENPNKPDSQLYKFNRNFLNNKAGGFTDKNLFFNVNEDNFKFDTGIEKLFYSILRLTKKAYR